MLHAKSKLSIVIVFVAFIGWSSSLGLVNDYKNVYFHFPYGGPYMGILTAFAVPLKVDTPGDVFLSVNFEAAYNLPENQTDFLYPPIIGTTARQILYELFEKKLESHGFPGRPCLLRTICESSELSTAGTGVLGDIIHFLLTPSASLNTNLTQEYLKAERQAKKGNKCKKYRKTCKFSLLKVFTWAENMLTHNAFTKKMFVLN